ncbi:predicted HAD superfamily hydrolase [Saccharomonospora viridis DSM 43017]|jgi:putative hydrolase of the HAD superfamily|uniref:Predicted HAD superfamily hydrolase n=1 Tax=Saccharomonospora viridis (strain ATCC 15386 / DSM 43017 / JCM 3036 / CCUG 5913 / NBRC 12207 / NCIMB 9602 / P101) TaxID=471857 RepID=C7MWT9_SACVD|nr:HAD family hydrolase [Saccharomonospora viridis]ACU97193.1 predicted HAD superfamily hydrolase [Saccharomonospora viridis DSM 43017]
MRGPVNRHELEDRVLGPGPVLLFDADDTLWENNVLFERAIDDFCGWVARPGLDAAAVRRLLDDIERVNSAVYGYGGAVFLRSLVQCLEQVRQRPVTPAERRRLERLTEAVLDCRVEPIPEVVDTLTVLQQRYPLVLVTKGDVVEQWRKLDRSGLKGHFRGVHVVREKTTAVYTWLSERYGLSPEATWMVGNSPASDIVPALAAGMGAVYVPNDNTWVLEHAELDTTAERLVTVERFGQLLDHF